MKKASIICVIAIGAVAAYFFMQKEAASVDGAPMQGPPQVMSLKAIKLAPQTITRYEELPGRTTAFKAAEIRPQVTGIVTGRYFTEGGFVEAGEQLYQIDPSAYAATYEATLADLRKAEANLDAANAKKKRYDGLIKANAVSRQAYEDVRTAQAQAQADVGIAKASIKQAKVNLDYTRVYAPISGVISKSAITEGALVTAGQETPLARITQLNPMYVDMNQSSADLMRLRTLISDFETVPVTLFLDQYDDLAYEHKGRLQFFDVTVQETTGTVQLRALFENPDNFLLPGLFVRAKIELVQPDALLVPQHAATRQPDGSLTVWKLDAEGKVQPTVINTSGAIKGDWIVARGLKADDVIITEGLLRLQPGISVKPVFASAAKPAPAADAATSQPASGE